MDDKFNLAPRAAFTYALRKGNIRGGYGMFYDWLESSVYEQVVRVDGTQQIDEIIINPSFPDPGLGSGESLAASRIQLGPQLTQPTIQQASIGYDRPFGEWGTFRTDYMLTRGHDTLRAVNVNAPLDGVRPDLTAGNVTQIESTGRARDRPHQRRHDAPDAARARPHGQRDVSVCEQPQLLGFAAGAAV